MRDGLPVLTFSGLVQDRDGYLWISTFDGLLRFDGAAFTVFDPSTHPELTSSRFANLQADPGGGGCVGSEVDGLLHVAAGEVRVVREDGKPLPPGSAVFTDRPGEAVYSTSECLYLVRGDEAKRIVGSEKFVAFCRPRRGAGASAQRVPMRLSPPWALSLTGPWSVRPVWAIWQRAPPLAPS